MPSATGATSAAQRFSILADLGIFPQDSAQPQPAASAGAAGAGGAGTATATAEGLQDGAGNGQYSMMVRGVRREIDRYRDR